MSDISKIIINTNEEYDLKDATARTGLSGKADNTPTFSEASTRANLSGSGETMPTILGKIKKYFSDLKDLAFIAKDGTSSTKFLRGDGTWQSISIPTKVSDLTNDSGFVTTDEKVKQQNTTTNASKRVLLSDSANDTTETSIALKSSKLTFNPNTGDLQTVQLNGVTVGNSPKFTDTNTTYAFGEGTNNGEIKITPSSGSAVTVKPKGISDLAYKSIDGSSSTKFLRGDGTWQKVTATDSTKLPLSGGTMTGTITTADGNIPAIRPTNDGNGSIGSSSNRYDLGYINYIHTKKIYIKGDGNYVATLGYESLAVQDATFYLPKNNGGTLVTDSYLNSNFLDIKRVTAGTNVTVNSGGYYKLGNLVIVNIRLTISSGASNTNIVYGLPTYSGENRVSVQNNKNLDLSITPEGKLQYSSTSVPTGTLVITASYVVNI